jgi:AhpD family alkylhydroperoxidase
MTTSNQAATEVAWALPGALSRLRPEACRLLTALNERTWRAGDPVLLELVRVRVAQLIGNPAAARVRCAYAAAVAGPELDAKVAALPAYPHSPLFSAAERDVAAFTEQFVIDVGGTTPEMRASLAGRSGMDGARALVTAIFVVEFTQRLQLVAARLLGDAGVPAAGSSGADSSGADSSAAGSGAGSCAALDGSPTGLLDAYQAAVVRDSALDPVTTELVRLRCARTHHCRICQTLRLADARAAGADEAMTAQVDWYERSNLPERAKVALRITDAFITRPDLLSDATAEQARTLLGPVQLASLCLDITKWSTQKIHVALDTDGADTLVTDADGVALFGFDSSGHPTGYRRR